MGVELSFFAYRFVKLLALLFIISSFVGFFRTYISHQKLKEYLIIKKGLDGHVTASVLGAITTFSSQSSTRLFLNFLDSGVPFGIALSFLITSPIINEYIAILLFVFFGWKITLIYLASGILIGTITGFILSKFNLENQIKKRIKYRPLEIEKKSKIKKKISVGINEGLVVLKRMWLLVLLGIIASILIKIYLSGDILSELVEYFGIFSVPIAIILGTPFPGNGAAIIPITVSLFEKGLPLGTAFSFLISVVGLSIPKILEFKRIMQSKLIWLIMGSLFVSILLIGTILNLVI